MNEIFARSREIRLLEMLYESGKPEFLAVYGRRRVGKTYLIRHFFKNKGLYFALTGVKGASLRKQLKNFAEEYVRVFGNKENYKAPSNWHEAFSQLRTAVEGIKQSERIILFFDELPWLATPRSGFLEDLDHFWNRYMSEDHRIIFIVCGSAASWMIRKIVKNKGGLHGRLTAQIRLLPFDLKETEDYLLQRGVVLDRKAIIDIYMALGGIPKYLNYVQKGQSAIQTVGHLCFGGPLTDEFDELFAALFDNYKRHIAIVRELAAKPYGVTRSQIIQLTGVAVGGGLSLILEELEQSGFILAIKDFGKQKKESRYRLVDEYSLFYLRWVQKAHESNPNGTDGIFWMNVFNSPLGQSWAGYAFENVCIKHLANLKKALGISGVLTSASSWAYKRAKGSEEKGTQIDLLIDRADNVINLCEIKYCSGEFVIAKTYDKELREKRAIFIQQTKTKKSVFITLISPYGVKNSGYFGTPDVTLTMDALFL